MIETWKASKETQAKLREAADAVEKHKLVYLHEQIAHIYRWWANEAPGVTPREDGHLANLWAEVDKLSEDELSGE